MHVPLLVNDFLRRPSLLYPDKVAVVEDDRRWTYRELDERVNRLAHGLLSLGVGKGDRVCMLGPNSHFFLESFYATSRIGAVLVPLNYRLVAADHRYILDHAGVEVVLADRDYTSVLDGVREDLPGVRHWVEAREEGDAAPGWTAWEALISDQPAEAPPVPDLDENDLVSINYTSGTTARPKGVMLTHRNCYLNAYNLIAHLGVRHDDVELWTLPMFHCNGWGGVYALTGMGGTHVVLRTVDARRIFELVEREGVTFACMAPAVLRMILDDPDRATHRIERTPRVTVAGAPPPADFVRRLEEDVGWRFLQIYGLTETSPLLTVSAPDHATRGDDWPRRARAGVPGIGVEVELRDPEGRPVPRDGKTPGEICARSNVVFAGYWRQPEATDEAIRDGWFHTGDLAVQDEVGNVHVVDRKKDVIITGGENVSSPEIEDVLYRHPAVLECAVIGVPDERWGETPLALVVPRPGEAPEPSELLDFCRQRLAHFKCPTRVELLDELPRTATGKLQKYRLRERYWEGRERRVN